MEASNGIPAPGNPREDNEIDMKKLLFAFLRALAVLSLIGLALSCGPTVDPVVEVTDLSLNQYSVTLEVGGTVSLSATVTPYNATDKTVTWSSSNPGVATVSGGTVTAVGEGNATITASAGSKKATCQVTVKPNVVEVTGIILNETEMTLQVGDVFTLSATVSPSNATDKTVTWSSSNPGVATVSGGNVTAVAEGEATITASAGSKSATCKFTVKPKVVAVTGITLNETEITLHIGETFQLKATVSPDNATDKTVEWASSAPALASVSDDGLVTAVKVGTGTISATSGTVSAKCKVTCIEWPKVESIAFKKDSYSVQVGQTVQLEFTYSPADAVNTDFTWSVADKDIAGIDNSGNLKGLAPGKTTVTVSADNGVKGSVEVTVTLQGGNEEYGYEELN